jgi:uncharacterized protein
VGQNQKIYFPRQASESCRNTLHLYGTVSENGRAILDWHEGELEVQRHAGVQEEMDYGGNKYKQEIPSGMAGFLAQQQFCVVSTADEQERVWAHLIAGAPGMIEVRNAKSMTFVRELVSTSIPAEDIASNSTVGLIVIDFSRRIRVRINGQAAVTPDGSLTIAVEQLYGNCTQYIQKRVLEELRQHHQAEPSESTTLSPDQQDFINHADTFFLASRHPQLGADASHRGGLPGFVRATTPNRISFPDYSGNHMFNTLGNIAANPSVGMLFVDFLSGRTLQITGRAAVDWDRDRTSQFEKAERVVDVDIISIRDTACEPWLRYRFVGYSPTLG